MNSGPLQDWLDRLGYVEGRGTLHYAGGQYEASHPYAPELEELLAPEGSIRASAVFDVGGYPTVAFFDAVGKPFDEATLLAARQRIWNQNLVSVVMVATEDELRILPASLKVAKMARLTKDHASQHSEYSAADVASGHLQRHQPGWFKPQNRVDKDLLKNLTATVKDLYSEHEVPLAAAQILMGQVLFISYLEHRHIVSERYRAERRVGTLATLISSADRGGIATLVGKLREDFNGDFLAHREQDVDWHDLSDDALDAVARFLSRVDIETGQTSFWNYDFSHIPVELLSGLYESFIGSDKKSLGAYYTPRHLANFVIDQALLESALPLDEQVIYDGACGSGILLTTAFRRLLAMREARTGRQLSLRERIQLLRAHIFGSDISDVACRVTAFSLYLSLLERLQPADVVALQSAEDVKLPPLRNVNLFAGPREGDFFSEHNPLASKGRFTLYLSNPPWREPAKTEAKSSVHLWADANGIFSSRKQLAGYFSHRALDSLQDGGRVCLILPSSLLLAPTSAPFIREWIARVRLERVINFGDLQGFLFEHAEHSCVVVLATKRPKGERVPADEVFSYWAPKADLSLAFNRLTLASTDNHRIQTLAYSASPTHLVTLMWGGRADLALIAKLRLLGPLRKVIGKGDGQWASRKGVHLKDGTEQQSAEPIMGLPEVTAEALKRPFPRIAKADLFPWGHGDKVAKLPAELLEAFKGPRILFPDGFDSEIEVRACYIDEPASFTSSIGVISAPADNAKALKFLTIYLRSSLMKYFLIMTAYQVLCDRNRATLSDLEGAPFVLPQLHPRPEVAKRVIDSAAKMIDGLPVNDFLVAEDEWISRKEEADELVFDYFLLSENERNLIREAVTELLPSIRPRGYKTIYTPAQRRGGDGILQVYAQTLRAELDEWKEQLGGRGHLAVDTFSVPEGYAGPYASVRVTLNSDPHAKSLPEVNHDAKAVASVLDALRAHDLLAPERGGAHLAADAILITSGAIYVARPLTRRNWLRRVAIDDAARIVEMVQRVRPDGELH